MSHLQLLPGHKVTLAPFPLLYAPCWTQDQALTLGRYRPDVQQQMNGGAGGGQQIPMQPQGGGVQGYGQQQQGPMQYK